MTDLHQQLNKWLDVLKGEVESLRIDQHIFWEVQEVIRANPKIHTPGDFNHWMGRMYATGMSVAIRRQIDSDARSISFLNFLKKLKANPTTVTRSSYKALFSSHDPDAYKDGCFDNLVGAGQNTLDLAAVEGEIQSLTEKTENLRHYVNKRIAHRDEKRFDGFPTFQDVDDAIDYLENLLKKYLNLFRGQSYTTLLPSWQYEWKEVFYLPWIDP